MRKNGGLFFSALMFLLFVLVPGFASAKPFYQGKAMTLIVCTRPGGGYDFLDG